MGASGICRHETVFLDKGIVSREQLSNFDRESATRSKLLQFKEMLKQPTITVIEPIVEQLLATLQEIPTLGLVFNMWLIENNVFIYLIDLQQYELLNALRTAGLFNPGERAPEEQQGLLAIKATAAFAKKDEQQYQAFLTLGLDLKMLAKIACQQPGGRELFVQLHHQRVISVEDDYSKEINAFAQVGDVEWLTLLATFGLEMTKAYRGYYPWNMGASAREFFLQAGFINEQNQVVRSRLEIQRDLRATSITDVTGASLPMLFSQSTVLHPVQAIVTTNSTPDIQMQLPVEVPVQNDVAATTELPPAVANLPYTWRCTLDEAHALYEEGKTVIQRSPTEALVLFRKSREKYRTIINDIDVDVEIVKRVEKRLRRLNSPDGKYSSHILQMK